MKSTKDNLLVYAAQNYYNPKCIDTEDFLEDLKRFKYIKRLLNRYRDSGVLSERLIRFGYCQLGNSSLPAESLSDQTGY